MRVITQLTIALAAIILFIIIRGLIVLFNTKTITSEKGEEILRCIDGIDLAIANIHTAVATVPLVLAAVFAMFNVEYDLSNLVIRQYLYFTLTVTLVAAAIGVIVQMILITRSKKDKI